MKDWTCPHGYGPGAARGDCVQCNADIDRRPDPSAMTGDERADEVHALLHDANAYRVSDIHQRIEALVGRSVWTHEFATDTRLMEEARGALPHPVDMVGHLSESFRAVAGDKPVLLVDAESGEVRSA